MQSISFAFRAGKEAYNAIPMWYTGQPVYPVSNFRNNALGGFRKNELIYSCITKKADSAASPRLIVEKDRTGEEISDHALRRLIANPNPFLTEFGFFYLTLIFLDLAGRAYFEKVRSASGQVVQLWPLRPDWVKPIPDQEVFIRGYYYEPYGQKKIFIDASNVLDFTLQDPLDSYNGLAPVTVASRIGSVDNSTTDFVKLFFEHGGMPPGIISTKMKLTGPDVKGIQARWQERYGGFKNWIVPAVLDKEASFQKIGLTAQEMGFESLDARSEARICMVLKVPPILVGAKVGLDRSTFSNYAEARKSFWQDTLFPQYKRIEDEMNASLANEFDGVKLSWDFSQVIALQEDQEKLWERAATALKSGGITRNEYRAEIGLKPVANGEVFLKPFTVEEIPARNSLKTKQQGLGKANKEFKGVDDPNDEIRRTIEVEYQEVVEKFFKGQEKRVYKQLSDTQSQLGAFTNEGFWTLEEGKFLEVIESIEGKAVAKSVEISLEALAKQTEVGLDSAPINEAARLWAKDHSLELVQRMTNTTKRAARNYLDDWIKNDEPLEALQKALEPLFGKSRAEAIAVTETTKAFQQGNLETWKGSKLVESFKFQTVVDDSVCVICEPLHNKVYPLADEKNQPPQHVRCRCFSIPVLKKI